MYGAIDNRKCLDLLIPAVGQVGPSRNVLLVVAGVQDCWLRKHVLLEAPAARLRQESRLVEFDRFVTVAEEQMLFTAADIVWSHSRNSFGSSGVLVRAGQYAKPVIVSDLGLVGKIVSEERCGLAVRNASVAAIAEAIVELASQPALRKQMGERAWARFSQHVPEAFAGPIRSAIESAPPVARGVPAE